MALNPARAMTLGPKALKQLQTTMETGDKTASVWIEKANSEAHMPVFAGGSKEKAAASFRDCPLFLQLRPFILNHLLTSASR